MMSGRRYLEADGPQQPIDQMGEGWLTNPPQRERRDRDAELGSGDVAVEVLQRDLDRSRPSQALSGHLVDLAAAGSDERELGGDKEAVERDERENGNETGRRCPNGGDVSRLCDNQPEQHEPVIYIVVASRALD